LKITSQKQKKRRIINRWQGIGFWDEPTVSRFHEECLSPRERLGVCLLVIWAFWEFEVFVDVKALGLYSSEKAELVNKSFSRASRVGDSTDCQIKDEKFTGPALTKDFQRETKVGHL
jgi:hypothetical protein